MEKYLVYFFTFLVSPSGSFVVSILFGLSAIYIPRMFLKGKRQTKDEMNSNQYEPIIGNYPFLVTIWLILLGIILFFVGMFLEKKVGKFSYNLGGAWFAFEALFDGMFAWKTGIFPVPEKIGYYYIIGDTDRLRRIGLFQIGYAILVIVSIIGFTILA